MWSILEYNERKLLVLRAVYELQEATVYDVWIYLDEDVSYSAIGMSLLRLHRQGLLYRYSYPKIYSLSERGVERLNWLESIFEEDEEEDEVGEIDFDGKVKQILKLLEEL